MTTDFEFAMSGEWYPQAEALLDEHHVVAVSGAEATRIRFGSYVAVQAEQMVHVEVCPIYGRYVRTLEDLAYMLSRSMPTRGPAAPTLEGLIDLMRGHRRTTKRRYIIWHDADVLAGADAELFGQVADVMMGVAAEQEYASEDLLILSRCLFLGGPGLAGCAAFSRWWSEGAEPALWQVVSGLDVPPVQRVSIVEG
jgi:hypothetical protein